MFGNNKKNTNQSPSISDSSSANGSANVSINSIGIGTTIEGTITSESDIRIDGAVKGNLNCKGKVIIGPKGKFDGELDCKNAVIDGFFKGKIKVGELLNVTESATIDGEVGTGQLAVHPGAKFNVSCFTGSGSHKSVSTSGNAKKPVTAG